MADHIQIKEVEETLTRLKSQIISEVSTPKLAATYVRVIDGFMKYCCESYSETPLRYAEILEKYYESTTNAKPFCRPDTVYLRRLARPILMIRDALGGCNTAYKYNYTVCEMPLVFTNDIMHYERWLNENDCSKSTVQTRIGRIKQFLITIQSIERIEMLDADILIEFISRLTGMYSSSGKTNILYTIRNYLSCPHIKQQLRFDPSPFLENLHTNKHERLESCYTLEEIKRVMSAVDRSTPEGKMDYLMMLLAGLYGLRSCDIRILKFSNIDWKRRLIILNQHKTGRYLELPLVDEVLLALLDYIKNGRPDATESYIFIRQRSPHIPYSDNNHFACKTANYFKLSEISTAGKHAGLHSLRHSLATALLKDGVSITDIADILGHASPQSTTRYIWSDIEQLRNAALEVTPYVK